MADIHVLNPSGEELLHLLIADGTPLLPPLREQLQPTGTMLETPCGGNGTCGKCEADLLSDAKATSILLCRAKAYGTMVIRLRSTFDSSAGGSITDTFTIPSATSSSLKPESRSRSGYGLAVDLGTTTVAARLINLSTNTIVGSASEWNAQIPYGADVISRIDYCNQHREDHPSGLSTLSSLIRSQVKDMAVRMLESVHGETLQRMVICGNTVMQHLFAGIDPSTIGVYPYQPASLFDDPTIYHFDEFKGCDITLVPCLSGYIGGDIMAGLLASSPAADGKTLFLDIGTNGEMALEHDGQILCCSTACGPAFEGAAISCGMRGVSGAIDHVELTNEGVRYTTIDQQPPLGICGSGLLDTIALLLKEEVIDESGRLLGPEEADGPLVNLLTEDENENGVFHFPSPNASSNPSDIYLTPEDVRKLQLAKAAVCAGVHTLEGAAGIRHEDVTLILLAGGFGSHLRKESLISIGMIPSGDPDRMMAIGNSALAGAQLLLEEPEAMSELLKIRRRCEYIELSTDPDFSERFMDCMFFE